MTHYAKKTQNACNSFENCYIECTIMFVDNDKYNARSYDELVATDTFVTKSETSLFEAQFNICNIAYEKCFYVNTEHCLIITMVVGTTTNTPSFTIFKSVILTTQMLKDVNDELYKAKVGTVHQYITQCYTTHLKKRTVVPMTIMFRKLKNNLLIESISVTIDNEISDALFERFVIHFNQMTYGPYIKKCEAI